MSDPYEWLREWATEEVESSSGDTNYPDAWAGIGTALAGLPAAVPPAQPCPTCSPPLRETVGMVCQTCGWDYTQGEKPAAVPLTECRHLYVPDAEDSDVRFCLNCDEAAPRPPVAEPCRVPSTPLLAYLSGDRSGRGHGMNEQEIAADLHAAWTREKQRTGERKCYCFAQAAALMPAVAAAITQATAAAWDEGCNYASTLAGNYSPDWASNPYRRAGQDGATPCPHPSFTFDRTMCAGCEAMPCVCEECGWHDCRPRETTA